MLRFACPVCNAVMEAPAQKVGQKIHCLKCGQRLQIPPPPQATILAKPLPLPEKAEPVALPLVHRPPQEKRALPPSIPWQSPVDPFAGIERPVQPDHGLPARWRRRRFAFLAIILGIVGVGILAAGAFLFLVGMGPLAGSPSTCQELVERLQAKGMDIDWAFFPDHLLPIRSSTHERPAVVIYDKGRHAKADAAVKMALKNNDQDMLFKNIDGVFGQYGNMVIVLQYRTAREAKEMAAARHPAWKDAFSYGRFLFLNGDEELMAEIKRKLD